MKGKGKLFQHIARNKHAL